MEERLSEWISVKDRMPTFPAIIVIRYDDGVTEIRDFSPTRGEYRNIFGTETGVPVTHWMPLPDPPKENE